MGHPVYCFDKTVGGLIRRICLLVEKEGARPFVVWWSSRVLDQSPRRRRMIDRSWNASWIGARVHLGLDGEIRGQSWFEYPRDLQVD